MKAESVFFTKALAQEYLEQLETLAAEIQVGIDAIEAYALPRFQESVSKQQAICTELVVLARHLQADAPKAEEPGALSRTLVHEDTFLASRIRFAAESVHMLNLEYAALLRHSGETMRLFAGLCRSYTGQFQAPAGDSVSRRATWH